MGDTLCAAGCKMGLLPDGEDCPACDGTGVATHGLPASQPKPEVRREPPPRLDDYIRPETVSGIHFVPPRRLL